MITSESEEETVRKFGVWKREMETWGLKVNISKTKLMVENLLLGHKGKVTMWGLRQGSWSKLNMVSML